MDVKTMKEMIAAVYEEHNNGLISDNELAVKIVGIASLLYEATKD